MIDLERAQEVACTAVMAACRATTAIQVARIQGDSMLKEDRSPVTTADFAAQTIICAHLQRAFPGVGIVSEENAEELAKPENDALLQSVLAYVSREVPGLTTADVCRLLDHAQGDGRQAAWVLDPVDGTKGFIRGDQYAVALGLLVGGKVVLGVLGCPNYRTRSPRQPSLFHARHGHGAYQRPLEGGPDVRIGVDRTRRPAEAIIIRGVESAHSQFDVIEAVQERLGAPPSALQMDGQGKYAAVARGDATVYLRIPRPASTRRESIWDHAAGVALVEEAGGRVTDIHGAPPDFTHGARLEANRGIVASSGVEHERYVEAVESAWAHSDPGPGPGGRTEA